MARTHRPAPESCLACRGGHLGDLPAGALWSGRGELAVREVAGPAEVPPTARWTSYSISGSTTGPRSPPIPRRHLGCSTAPRFGRRTPTRTATSSPGPSATTTRPWPLSASYRLALRMSSMRVIRISILCQGGARRAPRGAVFDAAASARAGRAASGRSPRGARLRSADAADGRATARAQSVITQQTHLYHLQ